MCGSGGTVLGLVDVMDLICGCGGVSGWRAIFSSAMNADDLSDRDSTSRLSFDAPEKPLRKGMQIRPSLVPESVPLLQVPRTIETREGGIGPISPSDSFGDSYIGELRDRNSYLAGPQFNNTMMNEDQGSSVAMSMDHNCTFKVADSKGSIHRITCDIKLDTLLSAVAGKMGTDVSPSAVRLSFVDDEGDIVLISSNDCLTDAIGLARNAGNMVVKLSAAVVNSTPSLTAQGSNTAMLVGAGVTALVAIVIVFAFSMRPKPK